MHNFLTRALNISRTWASWLADSGIGLRDGMGSFPVPTAAAPVEPLPSEDDGEAIVTDVVVCRGREVVVTSFARGQTIFGLRRTSVGSSLSRYDRRNVALRIDPMGRVIRRGGVVELSVVWVALGEVSGSRAVEFHLGQPASLELHGKEDPDLETRYEHKPRLICNVLINALSFYRTSQRLPKSHICISVIVSLYFTVATTWNYGIMFLYACVLSTNACA